MLVLKIRPSQNPLPEQPPIPNQAKPIEPKAIQNAPHLHAQGRPPGYGRPHPRDIRSRHGCWRYRCSSQDWWSRRCFPAPREGRRGLRHPPAREGEVARAPQEAPRAASSPPAIVGPH